MSIATLPFSKVRRVGDLVLLSGEMPFRADGSVPDGIGPQTDLVLDRIAATLEGEGLSLADAVSCTVYLTDSADFAAFNDAYARRFPEPRPVRTTVQAGLMVAGARIEITVIAQARA